MSFRNCTFHDTASDKTISQGELCSDPATHHALKYHDPTSPNYIGEDCVKCAFSIIEARLKAQWAKDNGLVEYTN